MEDPEAMEVEQARSPSVEEAVARAVSPSIEDDEPSAMEHAASPIEDGELDVVSKALRTPTKRRPSPAADARARDGEGRPAAAEAVDRA